MKKIVILIPLFLSGLCSPELTARLPEAKVLTEPVYRAPRMLTPHITTKDVAVATEPVAEIQASSVSALPTASSDGAASTPGIESVERATQTSSDSSVAFRDNALNQLYSQLTEKLAQPVPAVLTQQDYAFLEQAFTTYREAFKTVLLTLMAEIRSHSAYWEYQHNHRWEGIRMLRHNGLPSQYSTERITTCIHTLNELFQKQAHQLGLLEAYTLLPHHPALAAYEKQRIIHAFLELVPTQDSTLPVTSAQLVQALTRSCVRPYGPAEYRMSLLRMATHLAQVVQYETHTRATIAPVATPSHLARYWPLYALGAVALAGAHYCGYQKLQEAHTWWATQSKDFYEQRIKEPFQQFWATLTNNKDTLHTDRQVIEEDLQRSKQDLYTSLTDLLGSERGDYPPPETFKTLPAAEQTRLTQALFGERSEVLAKLGAPGSDNARVTLDLDPMRATLKDAQQAVKATVSTRGFPFMPDQAKFNISTKLPPGNPELKVSPETAALLLSFIHEWRSKIDRTELALKLFEQDTLLNRRLLVLIPGALISYGGLRLLQYAYTKIKKGKQFDTAPFTVALQRLFQFCIDHGHQSVSELTHADHGLLSFWLSQLNHEWRALPATPRGRLECHIQQLMAPNTPFRSKKDIIQLLLSMYTHSI